MGLETGALIALAGLAASAAGTGVQMYSSNEEARRANEAASAELTRQKGYQKQATGAFQKSLGESTPAVQKTQAGEGVGALLDVMGKVSAAPVATPSSVAGIAPSNTQEQETEQANRLSNATAANYGGMTEWSLRQWIKDLRAQQNLGIIQNLARGSEQTLPLMLGQAGQSAEDTRLLGTGLGAAGSALSSYGATMPRATIPTATGDGSEPSGINLGRGELMKSLMKPRRGVLQ